MKLRDSDSSLKESKFDKTFQNKIKSYCFSLIGHSRRFSGLEKSNIYALKHERGWPTRIAYY